MQGQPNPGDQRMARDPRQQMRREDDESGIPEYVDVQIPDGRSGDQQQVIAVKVVWQHQRLVLWSPSAASTQLLRQSAFVVEDDGAAFFASCCLRAGSHRVLPFGDGLLVAFDGPARGQLWAPAHAARDPPYMNGEVAYSKLLVQFRQRPLLQGFPALTGISPCNEKVGRAILDSRTQLEKPVRLTSPLNNSEERYRARSIVIAFLSQPRRLCLQQEWSCRRAFVSQSSVGL